ncbi:MAG TPA: BatD family protein, partial [Cyclobacteriaceae bacterium]|nr:BatD family protein [Cyclobacteriaceae bacterium]
MKIYIKTVAFLLFVSLSTLAWAQNVQVQLGPEEIGENQMWTITVVVSNDQLRTYTAFPDIDGFRKRGTSTQSQTSIVNGHVSTTQAVTMTYQPTRQGVFNVPAFDMTINNVAVKSPAKKITVGPAAQTQARDPFGRDPFRDFFGGREETEFIDVKDEAQLALSTNKDEVYVGEGFVATLSFLIADNNRATMQFHDLGPQLSDILKKLKPTNCWEENFNIENIEGEQVTINGRGYTQYKIYQGAFYPLNNETIVFPSVDLEMIKFRIAKNPSFFGQNRQEDFKTFSSRPKTVRVKELPPHPLRSSVAVGNYQLEEKITTSSPKTGQSVGYEFNIFGEGNISSVEKPTLPKDSNFDFYDPSVQQNISRENGRLTGTKSFKYFIVPKEPGKFALGDYFKWVFFNPSKKKYDTLRSKLELNVEGESQRNQAIQSTDFGSFYDRISIADNHLEAVSGSQWLTITANVLIVLMVGA